MRWGLTPHSPGIPIFARDFVMDRNMGLLFCGLASSVTRSEFDIGSMSRSNQLVWVTNFLEDVLVRSRVLLQHTSCLKDIRVTPGPRIQRFEGCRVAATLVFWLLKSSRVW